MAFRVIKFNWNWWLGRNMIIIWYSCTKWYETILIVKNAAHYGIKSQYNRGTYICLLIGIRHNIPAWSIARMNVKPLNRLNHVISLDCFAERGITLYRFVRVLCLHLAQGAVCYSLDFRFKFSRALPSPMTSREYQLLEHCEFTALRRAVSAVKWLLRRWSVIFF